MSPTPMYVQLGQNSQKKVLLLTPGKYGDTNYPGISQKYTEIADAFKRRGCDVNILGYRSTIFSLYRLSSDINLVEADIIWVRCPGVRLWLITLTLLPLSRKKHLILEHPSPFIHYFNLHHSQSFYNLLKNWVEIALTFLVFIIPGARFKTIIEYGNEPFFLAFLFRLNRVGLLLGNPVPKEICKAVKTNLMAFRRSADCTSPEDELPNIKFLIVANLELWHGLDRLIHGLGLAYRNARIASSLTVIGQVKPDIRKALDQLISMYEIQDSVEFLGQLPLSQVCALSGNFDIGISALATHRSGYHYASPLKAGLYAAVGMPFICSSTDIRFDRSFSYRYQCQASEFPVDIPEIIKWYQSLDPWTTSRRMHEYFLNMLSSDIVLAPLFTRLNLA